MAGRMKKLIKNNGCCFASALLAGAFFLFACYYHKAFPFDKNYCLLFSDLGQQYYPQLVHFYDIIHSGKDIFYSWSSALGYSFFGNFGNVSSPFNLIVLLFRREHIAFSITVIVIAKLTVIAYSFSYYLRKIYEHKGVFNIIPSLLYSLSGFFVAYYIHIMWLDALYCLPLVILGFHKLIDEKKPWLYLFTLTYMMVLSCYSAYMLCIFLCLYFIYYYFKTNSVKQDFSVGLLKSNFFKNGLTFAGVSVFSALLAAFFLVPAYFVLTNTAASNDSFERGIAFYYGPLQFIAQQFSGSSVIFQTSGDAKVANCWAGLLTVILIPAYLFSKAFSKKERILDISFLSFMFLSLSLNILSFVWCGFHFANGFGDRFGYFYIFLAVTVMSKALNNIDKIKKPAIIICAAAAAVFITLMRIFSPDSTEKYTLIISLGFIAAWLIVYLISWIKRLDKSLLKLVVLFVLCLELVFAQLENLNLNGDKRDYDRYSEQFDSTYALVKEKENDLFCRVEACSPQNDNYPFLMNYNGISGFSSVIPQALLKSQNTLGVSGGSYNFLMYFPNTPIYNSVFGIKYLIGESNGFELTDYFNKAVDNGYYSAFENNYYLPLGYCIDSAAGDYKSGEKTNPFFEQNELFSSFSGAGQVFDYCKYDNMEAEKAEFEADTVDETTYTEMFNMKKASDNEDDKCSVTFNFTIPEDGEYYYYISHDTKQKMTKVVYCSQEIDYAKTVCDFYLEPNCILPLGNCSKGDSFSVTFSVNEKTEKKPVAVYLASFNKEAFVEGYNKLKNNTLNLTDFQNTHFSGTVTADRECLLFTSVPYDKGWSVNLDGEKLSENEIVKIDNAYISVPLTEGEHTVDFSYTLYGFKLGCAVSSAALLSLIAFVIIRKRKQKA